jgi:deoxyhypusine synthase
MGVGVGRGRDILVGDMTTKKELLKDQVQHIDIKQHNVVALVDAMSSMAYSSRDLARAANIYEMMLRDTECGVILCLAGSLISAGLQKVIVDLVRNNMVDAIVSTGANIVDQDFFEALGFRHYIASDGYKYGGGDATLRELMIDRIYDTFIDEEQLRICDDTTKEITDSLETRAYSSRRTTSGLLRMGRTIRLCSRAMRRRCRFSARPSRIARLGLGWWRISMSGVGRLWCRLIRLRTSTS